MRAGSRLRNAPATRERVRPSEDSAGFQFPPDSAGGGLVLIATLEGGAAYAVQAIDPGGALVESRTFRSVGACRGGLTRPGRDRK